MKYGFFLVLTISLFSSCGSFNDSPLPKDSGYFIPIPFKKFSSIQAPCFDVHLDGQTYSMELDLGFQGDLTLDKELLDNIHSKTYIRTATIHGIQGKRYRTDLFQIPEASIGTASFIEPVLQSNCSEFTQDSVYVQEGLPSLQEIGRIGWQLFQGTNLLIDVAHAHIALCDSIDTLLTRGHKLENFAKAELFTDRGLLEFDATTSRGVLRCTLDTGASLNVLNIDTDRSVQEMIWEPENSVSTAVFKIGEQDFGPIPFHQIPIKIPIPIKAILGIEFFRQQLVFIDFSKKQVYFSRFREI